MTDDPVAPPQELVYFAYDHLPQHLQAVSKYFHDLAYELYNSLPKGKEREHALYNLLMAKDWAVRAAIRGVRK